MSILKNGLYLADCLVLLERLPDQSIDLVYIDPPWNTPKQLNKDTDQNYIRFMRRVIRQFRRVLAPTGNLLIHIDPKTGLYIRPLMDEIFDKDAYQPEISIPIRRNFSTTIYKSRAAHEIILHYAMSENSTYNRLIRKMTEKEAIQKGYRPDEDGRLFKTSPLASPMQRSDFYLEFRGHYPPDGSTWRYSLTRLLELDAEGRIYQPNPEKRPTLKRYLDEQPGIDITDDWQDIPVVERSRKYPHFLGQRPLILMDKLIKITSNPGDIVLDVFCGSGSTLVSAQNNGRRWIGCDNLEEAYWIAKERLEQESHIHFGTGNLTGDVNYLESKFDIVRSSNLPKVFISYSRRDEEEFVLPFCAKLEAEMIDYWKDKRDIEVGDRWREKLAQGLQECEGMILFISPASLNSPYVEEEYRAFLNEDKPIFPILCKETHIPSELRSIQYVQFSEHHKIIEKLRKHSWK